MDPSYFLLQALFEFQSREQHSRLKRFSHNQFLSIPQYNTSHSMRIGQELVVTEPFQSRMLFSKSNDYTLSIRSEMGGKVILSEMEFNDNGVVINNKIDGGISYSQTF